MLSPNDALSTQDPAAGRPRRRCTNGQASQATKQDRAGHQRTVRFALMAMTFVIRTAAGPALPRPLLPTSTSTSTAQRGRTAQIAACAQNLDGPAIMQACSISLLPSAWDGPEIGGGMPSRRFSERHRAGCATTSNRTVRRPPAISRLVTMSTHCAAFPGSVWSLCLDSLLGANSPVGCVATNVRTCWHPRPTRGPRRMCEVVDARRGPGRRLRLSRQRSGCDRRWSRLDHASRSFRARRPLRRSRFIWIQRSTAPVAVAPLHRFICGPDAKHAMLDSRSQTHLRPRTRLEYWTETCAPRTFWSPNLANGTG
jgi:hypothetical protein